MTDAPAPVSLKDKIIKLLPLVVITLMVGFFLLPVAQRQTASSVGDFISPDQAYKVTVYRYLSPFSDGPGSGYAILRGAGDDIPWDNAQIEDLSHLPPTWTATTVAFGPGEEILLPTAEELAKLEAEKKQQADEAAAKEALEKAAEARRNAE